MKLKKPSRRNQSTPRDRALKHLADGRLDDAQSWARSNEDSLDAEDLLAVARILKVTGDYPAVIAIYRRMLELQPDQSSFQLAIVCTLIESGQHDDANESLDSLRAERQLASAEHLAIASAFSGAGKWSDAAAHYRDAIEVGDNSIGTQVSFANTQSQLGNTKDAKSILQKAVANEPASLTAAESSAFARAWFNLGVLFESGQPERAVEAFRRSLSLNPTYAYPVPNLAILLMQQKQLQQAIDLLKPAVEQRIDWPRSGLLLASAQRLDGEQAAAIQILEQVVKQKDAPATAWEMMVRCLTDSGDLAGATKTCQQWLQRDRDSSVAKHMLASVQGADAPQRASAEYVTETFDGFADSFDSVLKNLQYQAPDLVGHLVKQVSSEPARDKVVLDAGCGTGLAGVHLRPYAKQLTGVDLSSNMLSHAKSRADYDELIQADLIQHLQQSPEQYDLIAAADTFNYFGDLSELLPMCFAALREGGWLVFTLECGETYGETYQLQPHGRYTHPPGYLMEQLAACGIEGGELHQSVLRTENGVDVQGLLAAVQKPAS